MFLIGGQIKLIVGLNCSKLGQTNELEVSDIEILEFLLSIIFFFVGGYLK